MAHYICKGTCGGSSDEIGICETEGCTHQWQMMEECNCTDGKHGKKAAASEIVVKDSNGTPLKNGDSVTLIKDLPLRGSSKVYKRGTKVSNISLTDNPEEVDCKIDGSAIVLRVEFLKKA